MGIRGEVMAVGVMGQKDWDEGEPGKIETPAGYGLKDYGASVPFTRRDFDAEAAALPAHDFDLLMHGYMLKRFEPWLTGVSALELGCYHGAFTERLAKIYPDVTVVEASEECIAIARGRAPLVEFVHSTFEDANLPHGHYDAIFLIHVLEHLDDPVLVLKRCREWLAPEGRLFVVVPNADAASRKIAVRMGLLTDELQVTAAERAHGHRMTYDETLLWRVVTKAGFGIEEYGGIMFKALANHQVDAALRAGIIDMQYLNGCYRLGRDYPELCASIYAVCS